MEHYYVILLLNLIIEFIRQFGDWKVDHNFILFTLFLYSVFLIAKQRFI